MSLRVYSVSGLSYVGSGLAAADNLFKNSHQLSIRFVVSELFNSECKQTIGANSARPKNNINLKSEL